MPSGAKKRKAAKKKKNVHNPTQSHQGENDGGELSSPASQDHGNIQDPSMEGGEVVEVKKEENSSETKSKNSNEEEGGNIEIEIGSKSKSLNGSSSSSSSGSSDDEVEKKVVILESAPIESLPEKITQKVEDLEVSPIVEPVIKPAESLAEEVSQDCDEPVIKPAESLAEEVSQDCDEPVIKPAEPLAEEVSQDCDEPIIKPAESLAEEVLQDCDESKNEEKKESVVEEKTVVVSDNELKEDCLISSVVVESVSKENGVEKLGSLESKDCVASSTSEKDSISEVNGANRAKDNDAIGHSDRQPPIAASVPLAVQKTTSWKSCCGLFDLFSGSER